MHLSKSKRRKLAAETFRQRLAAVQPDIDLTVVDALRPYRRITAATSRSFRNYATFRARTLAHLYNQTILQESNKARDVRRFLKGELHCLELNGLVYINRNCGDVDMDTLVTLAARL